MGHLPNSEGLQLKQPKAIFQQNRHWFRWVCWVVLVAVGLVPAHAQETAAHSRLVITAVDSTHLPSITLRAYGTQPDGSRLDLASQALRINHGDQTIEQVTAVGSETVGTLTLFLVDTPVGTEPALPAIQAAIEQYASAPYMQEAGDRPVDYVAIYQVEATQSQALLPPNEYYNSVRNLFVDPLPIESGPTALIDSLMSLLNSAESLKPNPALFTSIVVFSDGTDVVSTQFQEADVLRTAANLGIPVHTVLLDTTAFGLSTGGTEFMNKVAQASGGTAVRISQTANLATIWERISQFRTQTVLSYTPQLAGGEFPILLSLADDPVAQAGGTVSIASTAVYVNLDIPAESQTLVLPDVAETITLRWPIRVGWVDGTERAITQAQLLVNGQVVADLDPANLATAEAAVSNLNFGNNSVQIALADELAQRAASPLLTLVVAQGDTAAIPELLQATGSGVTSGVWQIVWYCLLALVLLAAVGGVLYALRGRSPALAGLWERFGTRPRRPRVTITDAPAPVTNGGATYHAVRQPTFILQVLACQSQMPAVLPLTALEIRIGRASAQADIAFTADPTVSRLHASLVRENNSYRLYDEQSTSGTLVNSQPVPDYGALLVDGDEIHLGEVHLRFHMNAGG